MISVDHDQYLFPGIVVKLQGLSQLIVDFCYRKFMKFVYNVYIHPGHIFYKYG